MSEAKTGEPGEAGKLPRKAPLHLATLGAVTAAIAASTCCIVPLILFSLGITGAWLGNLTALSPYKPLFLTAALGFLAYGFRLVYRPAPCGNGAACTRPLPNRLVKTVLWLSTALVITALLWRWIAPVLAPILLGL